MSVSLPLTAQLSQAGWSRQCLREFCCSNIKGQLTKSDRLLVISPGGTLVAGHRSVESRTARLLLPIGKYLTMGPRQCHTVSNADELDYLRICFRPELQA